MEKWVPHWTQHLWWLLYWIKELVHQLALGRSSQVIFDSEAEQINIFMHIWWNEGLENKTYLFFRFLCKHSWKSSLTFHSTPDQFWFLLLLLISPTENSIRLTSCSFSFINQVVHLPPVSAQCQTLEEIQRHRTRGFCLERGGNLARGTSSAQLKAQ